MTEKVTFKDFEKLNFKVGKIISVEDHPSADKLYVLKVDLKEDEPRTIVAGLKKHYKKDDLKNKLAIFAANLEPAKLRGIESNGMILAAVSHDREKVVILTPEKDIEVGSKIS